MDAALVRLQARMRALAWNSRAAQAHHLEQMAQLRNEDGRAHAAWREICETRRKHWEAVANG